MNNLRLISELAGKLAINRVNISLWDAIRRSKENVYKKVLKSHVKVSEIELPERYIVVVGAGASKDAAGLPLGKKTATVLQGMFRDKMGKNKLIESELQRLERVYRLNEENFETILLAISKFYPAELIDELSKRYYHRYYPSLTYEIIAHLMKHRFVDAVINFNFDELLDQAIADEMGSEEYKKIIAEGDYDEDYIFDSTGLKHPVYLKPHGTCSNASSLRFTREGYFALPRAITSMLRKLLSGTKARIGSAIYTTPVNLIVIGFNMQSFEFNLLIEEHLPPDSNIYFINTETPRQPELPGVKDKKKQYRREMFESMFHDGNLIRVTGTQPLDDVLKDLWNKTERCFDDKYKPRSIVRHQVIAGLFKRNKSSDKNILEYIRNRAWVELAFSIAKYKGFVTLHQLENDRFGKYYFIYRRMTASLRGNKHPRTIMQFCIAIGLHPVAYSSQVFSLDPRVSGPAYTARDSLTVSLNFFRQHMGPLLTKLTEKLNGRARSRLNSRKKEFTATLLKLFMKEDGEISPKYDISYLGTFRDPKLIRTSLALDYLTRSLFTSKVTALFVVAETGEWIIKKLKEFGQKKIVLVIADSRKFKKDRRNLEIYPLNWWLHNQHMTIFLEGKAPNYKPVRAIYFERRYRQTHIHPIQLTHKDDLKLLLESFAAYCRKAENIQRYVDSKLPAEVSSADIKSFLKQYFSSRIIS